jgi:membrane protease YdiL (CAAX protease family)
VTAYLLSWAWLIPAALTGGVIVPGEGWPTHFPALLGPAAAALILTAWRDGRAGLVDLGRRMVRVRIPARWWLFAVSPLLLVPLVVTVSAVLGRGAPAIGDFAVISGLPSGLGVLGVAAVVLFVNGFGEETGWRGYTQHTLQRTHGPLVATLVVALLWAGWHAPMFFTVASFRDLGVGTTVGWFLGLFCGALVLTWLYNRTGGSIALVAVWHATYNLVSGTDAATGLLAAVATTLVIALAMLLLALEVRALRRGSATVLGPAVAAEPSIRTR